MGTWFGWALLAVLVVLCGIVGVLRWREDTDAPAPCTCPDPEHHR